MQTCNDFIIKLLKEHIDDTPLKETSKIMYDIINGTYRWTQPIIYKNFSKQQKQALVTKLFNPETLIGKRMINLFIFKGSRHEDLPVELVIEDLLDHLILNLLGFGGDLEVPINSNGTLINRVLVEYREESSKELFKLINFNYPLDMCYDRDKNIPTLEFKRTIRAAMRLINIYWNPLGQRKEFHKFLNDCIVHRGDKTNEMVNFLPMRFIETHFLSKLFLMEQASLNFMLEQNLDFKYGVD